MIKAIFFDIDGTLLSFKQPRHIPISTLLALKELHKKGIKLFIATGRSAMQIDMLKDHLPFEFDGYVSLNGQYCYNKDKIIHQQTIPTEDIAACLPYLQQSKIGCNFVELDYIYLNTVTDKVTEVWKTFGRPVSDNTMDTPNRALTNPTYQLCAYVTDEEEAELLKHLPNCKAVRWHPGFADIIPKTGGKNIGIQKILDYYGIDISEAMAFGDGGNDIDMLKYVGTGIAMGNAEDDVKASADYVTTSVDDDGIMNALNHFGII